MQLVLPRKKAHLGRAKALTVRLLWMVWIDRGKGAKSLPTASQSIVKAVPLCSSTWGFPRRNWFVARDSPVQPSKTLYSARPC